MIRKLLEQIVKDIEIYPANTSTKRKPEYPFLTYNLLNIKTRLNHDGILQSGEDNTRETTQPQAILSINAYGRHDIEAIEGARKAYHYFRYANELDDINYVVVDVGDIVNRTVLITDHYEFRYGFDVWIRYEDKIDKENKTIEDGSVNINYD